MILMSESNFKFSTTVWKNEGAGGWYFASCPKDISKKIRKLYQEDEEGWGRLKAQIKINKTSWNTSIWFDTKMDTYLIPIKADIRRKEGIADGSGVAIEVVI